MNIEDKNLDFIVLAHQRSGTHLLCSFLNSHPEIACIGEPNDVHPAYMKENMKQKKVNGRLVADNHPYKHLLNKKIIFLHRDPLQNATSRILTIMKKEDGKERKRPSRFYREVAFSEEINMKKARKLAATIKLINKEIKNNIENSNYIEITYEEMSNNKNVKILNQESTKKVCDFLGVSFHEMGTEFFKPTWNLIKNE